MLFRSPALCLFFVLLTVDVISAQVTSLNRLPNGLSPGDQFRYVFVTNGTRDAASTDITDYDAFVTNDANTVGSLVSGLGLTFQVIGSTSAVDAVDHIATGGRVDVPFALINGDIVAGGSLELFDGSLPINFDLTLSGNRYVGNVFTGSRGDGIAEPGNELGSVVGEVQIGDTIGGPEASAISNGGKDFDFVSGRFYGISSVVTAVPEPTSLFVFGVAGVGFASRRRRCFVA